ncbi:MAG: 4-hydroxy-tetrahydrodipicolinate reductase [Lachnospiraceae bacterium]|jgi:dihydrodipicolinate reductase|nr:4-hydroxy-tetrahydrodipicolinate reductase [Lachnospiraceae bacterium]MCI8825271.1 4-hydroxy-tetrahydrodipicolinate reductase [Lachnospiraceae bacterium]MCI9371101.1 4-hydroxy-tetrahydrodipicolinate reductase [Lachnospiraceae bacterium]
MTRIIMTGCNGKMGKTISEIVAEDEEAVIVAGVDISEGTRDYPVYKKISDVKEEADVVIDFSTPKLLDEILSFAIEKQIPTVLCTTGYSAEQIEQINQTANQTALLRSANMSLGINIMIKVMETVAKTLADTGFDIEIVERHHNQKLDAPSGTALALADAINKELDNDYDYKYDRSTLREKRPKKEIGISAVRGGTIVGEHEIIFAGTDEVIEFKHTAYSKAIFGKGAVEAAKFLKGKQTGLYDMKDVMG